MSYHENRLLKSDLGYEKIRFPPYSYWRKNGGYSFRHVDSGGKMADNGGMPFEKLRDNELAYKIMYSDRFVTLLMEIAEKKPFLDAQLGSPLEVKLMRQAKIKAVTFSNQIEGNELEEKEVQAIMKGSKAVKGSKQHIKEVQNYHTAIDYVEQLAKREQRFNVDDLCHIQKLVTKGLLPPEKCGMIRDIPVSIVNARTGDEIDVCPEPEDLPELVDELFEWLDETDGYNPFARAFAFHHNLVAVHPFADGNGRTARLIQHFLFLREGLEIARFVPSETAIMKRRDRYYASIRQSKALQSMHPFLEFMAEAFSIAAEEVVAEGRSLLRQSAGKTPKARQQRIVKLAKDSQKLTIQQVIEQMPDVPRRTIERDLATLVKEKSLKAVGTKKARHYKVAKA